MNPEHLLTDDNYDYNYDGGYELENKIFTDILGGGYELNDSIADEIVNNILGGNESESEYQNIYGGNNDLEYQEDYEYLYGGDNKQISEEEDNEAHNIGGYDLDISDYNEEIVRSDIESEIKQISGGEDNEAHSIGG